MPSNTYTCNGCRKTLIFDDYPPVGNLSIGFTCPECSKLAKSIAAELKARLLQCGEDGEIIQDYYTHKLTPTQLSVKYSCTVEQALYRVERCLSYITGEKRKDISYDEWVRSHIREEKWLTGIAQAMLRHLEGSAEAIIWDCLYCDSKIVNGEQMVLHLIDKHRLEMQKLVDCCHSPQTIRWAAELAAAFCSHDKYEATP